MSDLQTEVQQGIDRAIELNVDCWHERQNEPVVTMLRDKLEEGDSILVYLQPGDATRYKILLAPITLAREVEVSNDGREPEVSSYGTCWLYVEILNEGFAGKTARFKHTAKTNVRDVMRRMDISNVFTAAAISVAINRLWCD